MDSIRQMMDLLQKSVATASVNEDIRGSTSQANEIFRKSLPIDRAKNP
jgi:hypothetical protein